MHLRHNIIYKENLQYNSNKKIKKMVIKSFSAIFLALFSTIFIKSEFYDISCICRL